MCTIHAIVPAMIRVQCLALPMSLLRDITWLQVWNPTQHSTLLSKGTRRDLLPPSHLLLNWSLKQHSPLFSHCCHLAVQRSKQRKEEHRDSRQPPNTSSLPLPVSASTCSRLATYKQTGREEDAGSRRVLSISPSFSECSSQAVYLTTAKWEAGKVKVRRCPASSSVCCYVCLQQWHWRKRLVRPVIFSHQESY